MFDFPLSSATETKTHNIHCFLQTCQNNLHSVEKLTFQKEFKANKDKYCSILKRLINNIKINQCLDKFLKRKYGCFDAKISL